MNHILNCGYEIRWSYDPRSYECNFNNCVEKSEKFSTSKGFEPVTSRYQCGALTNWAMKPLMLGAGHLWVHMFWSRDEWINERNDTCIWNESYFKSSASFWVFVVQVTSGPKWTWHQCVGGSSWKGQHWEKTMILLWMGLVTNRSQLKINLSQGFNSVIIIARCVSSCVFVCSKCR